MSPNRKKIPKSKHEGRKYQRMEIVAPLFKRGYSYREIKDEVKAKLNLTSYSLQTVKRDIDDLLKEWQECRVADMDVNIQLELTRIDAVVKEAWGAWEDSKMMDGRGDPRYLDVINRNLQERRKILGLYAPDKSVSVSSEKVDVGKIDDMSVEEVEKEFQRLMKLAK